ncbi:MAG TPA: hypothetical protein VHE30_27075 [Polyangiaceae bacterium]|nr:hypothetical protein [Polyangiaceae bacterium]
MTRLAAPALALLAMGCSVRVAGDLDESEANRVVAALQERDIAAEELPVAGTDRFTVNVPRGDAARAATALSSDGLPERTARASETGGLSPLVPSLAAENARLTARAAAELERTLRDVPGVTSARVHLAVPRRDPLSGEEPARGKASVLLRKRAGAPGPSTDDVRRLVAGAVTGVAPEDVAVVFAEVPRNAAADVVQLGPFSTSRETARAARLALGVAALLNVSLVAVVVGLWLRVRRRRGALRPGERLAGEAR